MESKEIEKGAKRLRNMYFSPVRNVLEKAEEIRKQGHCVISFSAGEPNFNTPEQIKQKTIEGIQKNMSHYAPNRGILDLRKDISKMLYKKNGLKYDAKTEIILTSGGAEAVNNTILALVDEGDEVIVFTPAFMNYENMIQMAGGVMVSIDLKQEEGFQIDLERVKQNITDKTKLIIINNPCNPTGVVYTKEILEGLSKIICENNLLALSDEIYNQITYDGIDCVSIGSFEGMKERTITMNGFSKAYAMTGWRVGILATDKSLMPHILKVHQYTTTCIPTFIQYGLIDTMNTQPTQKVIDTMVEAFSKRRRLLMDVLDKIEQFSYCKPYGAFYVFVNVRGTGLNGEAFAKKLLEEKYVAVVPGIGLGKECGDFIRISFAASDEDILEGMKRIEELVNELNDCSYN